MGINMADVIIKINEFQKIDDETIIKAVEESTCTPINFIFLVLYLEVIRNGCKISLNEAKRYAIQFIHSVESALSITCSKRERDVISECFAVIKCGSYQTVADCVSSIELMADEYNDENPGTIVWVALNSLKRELLRFYSYDYSSFQKMKNLIDELKPTDDLYKQCIKEI